MVSSHSGGESISLRGESIFCSISFSVKVREYKAPIVKELLDAGARWDLKNFFLKIESFWQDCCWLDLIIFFN